MTIGSRLKILRKKINKSQRDFAYILGISQSAYSNYEKDERSMPSDLLSKIIISYRLNSEWLINGIGDMLITPENVEKMISTTDNTLVKQARDKNNFTQQQLADILQVSKAYISQVEQGKVKLSSDNRQKVQSMLNTCTNNDETIKIERIHINPSCGTGTIVLDEAEVTPIILGTKLIQNIFKIQDIRSLKVFKASGDSMEPTIYDGDDVLVDINRNDYINGGVFIIEKLGDWFIKRLRLKFDGSLEIISDNSTKYSPEIIKQSDGIDINIKGRVIKNLSRGL